LITNLFGALAELTLGTRSMAGYLIETRMPKVCRILTMSIIPVPNNQPIISFQTSMVALQIDIFKVKFNPFKKLTTQDLMGPRVEDHRYLRLQEGAIKRS